MEVSLEGNFTLLTPILGIDGFNVGWCLVSRDVNETFVDASMEVFFVKGALARTCCLHARQ